MSVYQESLSIEFKYGLNFNTKIKTIFLDLRPRDFPKNLVSIFTFKKDMTVYIAKNVCFDTIKGIKNNRALPVDLEL